MTTKANDVKFSSVHQFAVFAPVWTKPITAGPHNMHKHNTGKFSIGHSRVGAPFQGAVLTELWHKKMDSSTSDDFMQ